MGSKEISMRVKAVRKELNLTQEELADKAGVSVSTVRNIEAGRGWTSDVMDRINIVLNNAIW